MAIPPFLALNYLIPHKGAHLVEWSHIQAVLNESTGFQTGGIVILMALQAVFITLAVILNIWNARMSFKLVQIKSYSSQLKYHHFIDNMAVPLSLAMLLNSGAFAFSSLFGHIPEWFWSLQLALLAVLVLVNFYILSTYFAHKFKHGDFDFDQNNHFGQLLAIFSIAFVGSLAAAGPGVFGHNHSVAVLSVLLSKFSYGVAIILGLAKLTLSFKSILRKGLDASATASLLILPVIVVVLGIATVRGHIALSQGLSNKPDAAYLFNVSLTMFATALAFAAFGWLMMSVTGYIRDYIFGDKVNAASFTVVCPAVALFVSGHLALKFGTKAGFFVKYTVTTNIIMSMLALIFVLGAVAALVLVMKHVQRGVCLPVENSESTS